MASFEDYDEFGNYIGGDLDSDDDEQEEVQDHFAPQPQQQPLEGFDDEPTGADDDAMDVDSASPSLRSLLYVVVSPVATLQFLETRSYFMKTKSTIQLPGKYTAKM